MARSRISSEIFNVPYSHIVYSTVVYAILLLCTLAIARVIHLSFRRFTSRPIQLSAFPQLLLAIKTPSVILVSLALILPTLEYSGVSVILRGFLSPITDIVSTILLAVIVVKIIDAIVERTLIQARDKGSAGSLSIISLGRRGIRLFIIFLAILAVLASIGFDLTTGLAALGIGGIAIALGSAKAIEHFVGSVTVVADQIVRIGDLCRFGTTLGTVEDIGIRSTRLRTLDRTQVIIPNGVFSSIEIENLTNRDMYLFRHQIHLAPRTSHQQIIFCLEEFRNLLAQEETVDPDPARVRLLSFLNSQPGIEIFAYIHAIDWNDFLKHQENLLLRVMAVIGNSGTQIAMPSQQNYSSGPQNDPCPALNTGDPEAPEDAPGMRSEVATPVQLPLFDAVPR